ncbi:MAG TPA: exopolysaccharide biosynthesis protein [Steroidobacteraceae bacterium]|nr:exopolysaccharide biosynthesis protein [Steroidobacteraceae bacterium]
MQLRTSEILLEFARTFQGERVRLGDLDQLLADRAFGFLMLVFALPNTLPLGIPAISTVTGIPLALVAFQMVLGMPKPYLPGWLARRSLRRNDFERLVRATAPKLERLERVMKPRWSWLQNRAAERCLGAFCLLLAVVLALPIPFGNVPPAVAVTLISLGIIEKDGVLMTVGFAAGIGSLLFVWGVLWAMIGAAIKFMRVTAGA